MLFKRGPDPGPFTRYAHYRAHLRELFGQRCAYCLIHEVERGGDDVFEIDHFRPKSRDDFAHLEHTWTNLYYCCRPCNSASGKSRHWPTPAEYAQGKRFVDPCEEDPLEHLQFPRNHWDSGQLAALTVPGRYSRDKIRLDRQQFKDLRRRLVGDLRQLESSMARCVTCIELVKEIPDAWPDKGRILSNLEAEHAHLKRQIDSVIARIPYFEPSLTDSYS